MEIKFTARKIKMEDVTEAMKEITTIYNRQRKSDSLLLKHSKQNA